jgi:chromosomal replication initiation ATPase DnaA
MSSKEKTTSNLDSWQNVLIKLQKEISPGHFKTWFTDVTKVFSDQNRLTLIVPGLFEQKNLVDKHGKQILEAWHEVSGNWVVLEIKTKNANDKPAILVYNPEVDVRRKTLR